MKLTPQQLEQFDRDGYLFFPSLFTPEEVKVLRQLRGAGQRRQPVDQPPLRRQPGPLRRQQIGRAHV